MNIPCLVKRPVSPNFRRMNAFRPSTLTVDFTVSVEMSQETTLWTGSAFEVDIGHARRET